MNMVEDELLRLRRSLVIDGLDYIEAHFRQHNFLVALSHLGWECVIVLDNDWPVGKTYPTETSKDDKQVRILDSYIKSNPSFYEYGDECGWANHELVHAAIFHESVPHRFLFKSPFEYPFSTDEIFCFGFQIRHLLEDGRYYNLKQFYESNMPCIGMAVDRIRRVLFPDVIGRAVTCWT